MVSELSSRMRAVVTLGGLVGLCLLAAFTAHAVIGLGGPGTDTLFNTWIYNALMLTGAAACLLRAVLVRRERVAWALLGAAILLIGERIIASSAALVPVARLVRSSGERWDGSGYPDGLRAEQIPLGARVVAVCEAYAAMVSERPYSQTSETP